MKQTRSEKYPVPKPAFNKRITTDSLHAETLSSPSLVQLELMTPLSWEYRGFRVEMFDSD